MDTASLFANEQEKSDLRKILPSMRMSGGDNARGHTYGCAVSGNIGEDQSHGAYFCSRSNVNTTYHLRVRAKLDAIADDGGVVRAVAISDRHALPQSAVCSKLCGGMQKNVAKMPDSQSRTNVTGFRQTDPGDGFTYMKKEPVQAGKERLSKS
jgi:hypothetical protein